MASTINITLPEPLMAYVEAETESGEHGTPGQYIRSLIQSDRERKRRDLKEYFEGVMAEPSRGVEISDADWTGGNVVRVLKEHAKTLR